MPRYIDADEIAEYIICDDGGGMGCEMGNPNGHLIHGLCGTSLYAIWQTMKQRCETPPIVEDMNGTEQKESEFAQSGRRLQYFMIGQKATPTLPSLIKNDVRPTRRTVATSWGRNRKWQLKYLSAVLLAHIGASLRRTIEKPLPRA